MNSQPPRSLVLLAFAIIYVVWGSTYLAIRLGVETIPAFFSASARFLVAGVLLMAFLALRGAKLPTRAQWKHSAVTGLLLLLGGNGLVVWAEQSLSSGLAALLVALAPVWFALLDWARPGGQRPAFKTVVGIAIGFLGVILLIKGSHGAEVHSFSFPGAVAVIFAGISWAAGSLYAKHSTAGGSPWMNASAQMIVGGGGLMLASIVAGEPARIHGSAFSIRSILALAYLVIFGSWIAFSAYVWLLRVTTPSRVSTYAYVNPVIAVFLGWAVLDEVVTPRMLWGAIVILVGILIITLPQSTFGAFQARLRPRRNSGSPAAEKCPAS